MESEINYDKLIEKSLRNVVKEALSYAQNNGLGENHFYITFKTSAKGVKIPDLLKEQYPTLMTIVLQYQFSNLTVTDDFFSVDLQFGGIPYSLQIPFSSVTAFADPYAKFGLNFTDFEPQEADLKENSEEKKEPAQVISIDSFRKK